MLQRTVLLGWHHRFGSIPNVVGSRSATLAYAQRLQIFHSGVPGAACGDEIGAIESHGLSSEKRWWAEKGSPCNELLT